MIEDVYFSPFQKDVMHIIRAIRHAPPQDITDASRDAHAQNVPPAEEWAKLPPIFSFRFRQEIDVDAAKMRAQKCR